MLEQLKNFRMLRFAGLVVVTYLLIGSGLAVTFGEQKVSWKNFVRATVTWPRYIKLLLDTLRDGF